MDETFWGVESAAAVEQIKTYIANMVRPEDGNLAQRLTLRFPLNNNNNNKLVAQEVLQWFGSVRIGRLASLVLVKNVVLKNCKLGKQVAASLN